MLGFQALFDFKDLKIPVCQYLTQATYSSVLEQNLFVYIDFQTYFTGLCLLPVNL